MKKKLIDKLIQEANAGEKFVDFIDLQKKVSYSKSVLLHTWRKEVDKLDTMTDKVSKVFDNIVNNNEALVSTKEFVKGSSMAKSNLLKKTIAERSGVASSETLMKGLNQNKLYKKHKKIINYISYGMREIPQGTTFNELFEEGSRRIGGGVTWTYGTGQRLIPDASKTVMDYALRHWNQNNLWGD